MILRTLAPGDIPAMLALAHAAGWNQTAEDLEMLLRLAPQGCFGIECDGRVVATTTLLPRSPQMAWLGMVLTGQAYQRRGLARRLVERALDYAAALDVPTVKLDATDVGRPLYLSLGFRDEQPVERWAGRLAQPCPGTRQVPEDSPLLAALAARSEVFRSADAYALARPGARARYLGPFVAASAEAARALVDAAFRGSVGDAFYWDVLPNNTAAIRLLRGLGFERVRSLVRMARGPGLPADDGRVYAIAGFELG